ncbi:MAG: DNA-3-methyladenine glycosylase [Fimbriimonadaceae bacterium]|nr:DNA-3-methyladenine glycosylase [Fimbriimonadaceae bacterium]
MDLRRLLAGPVERAAPALLGWDLVHDDLRVRLVEVEAYAQDEPGCHAFRGPTPRNRVMFGPPGFAYLYFTYGNHWMLNVTAEPEGRGCAVLLRAAEPLDGLDAMAERRPKARRPEDLLNGPGKLAAALALDQTQYGFDLLDPRSPLRLEPGEPPGSLLVGTRIGIAKGKGDEIPWRFADGGRLRWVSRPLQGLSPTGTIGPSPDAGRTGR